MRKRRPTNFPLASAPIGDGPAAADHRGKGPQGWRPDDARLLDHVCRRLTEDAWVDAREVDVLVEDGVVALRGQVRSGVERRRAEDLAWEVVGVVDVVNELLAPRRPFGEEHISSGTASDQGPDR